MLDNPRLGEGYVPAYQISATPFVTSSNITLGAVKAINFPQVTRFITLKNTGPSTSVLAAAFTANGFNTSNYFFLSGSEAFSAELRTNSLFLSGSADAPTFTLIAGLTYIPANAMLTLTGSNGIQGVG